MFLTAISLHINHKLKSLTPIDEWKDENIILQLEAWLSPNMGLNFNSLKKFLMGDIQNAHYITRLEKLTKAIKVFNNFNLTNEKKMEALTTPYFPVMNGEGKDRGVYWLSLRDILTDDNTYKEDTAHEIVEQYAYFISFQYKK
jgi:hypothetical protein